MIPQVADLIVVALHAVVLLLDDQPDIVGQFFLERFSITSLRDIFAAFTFLENGEIRAARRGRLQADPATVDCAGNTAVLLRIAAQTRNQLPEIGYGLKHHRWRRYLPKIALKLATRVVANSENGKREALETSTFDPRSSR